MTAQESREATRVSFCLRKKVSTINTFLELPYALSEDGGDEDMQDGGNDITDDDYTPSVLPTSPIGRSPMLHTYIICRKECMLFFIVCPTLLPGKSNSPRSSFGKSLDMSVFRCLSVNCSPYTSQPHRTPFPVLLLLGRAFYAPAGGQYIHKLTHLAPVKTKK